jgi:hypothetical protein
MTKARNIADLLDANGIVDNAKITLDANEIPNLDASKIVSGDISAARLSLATETKPAISSVSPTIITNDATDITITGTDFTAIPRVDIINTATGIWYSVNTVTHDSATQLTVNVTLPVDAGTYRIRVENPDGLAGLSGANFLTVSDAPTWSTGAGSLGTIAGGLNGAVATVSAGGDSIVYSETTNVLTNASLANCSLNSSTGAITTSDFDGSSTSARTHTFTIRATDAQNQTSDREFTLTSSYSYTINALVVAGGGAGNNSNSGGGGGGGMRTTNWTSGASVVYTIVVGQGGTAGVGTRGSQGGNSSIAGTGVPSTPFTSSGGGQGGRDSVGGGAGGAGGGGGYQSNGGSGNDPSTSPSQGANGGNGLYSAPGYPGGGGGGGGASGVTGQNGVSGGQAGNGGNGTQSSITGTAVYYAGGGGGAIESNHTYGNGGLGGGGDGGNANQTAQNGTDGLGGGGGSAYANTSGDGGNGVVILSVPTASYSGTTSGSPTVTTSGGNTIIKFLANGTYTS